MHVMDYEAFLRVRKHTVNTEEIHADYCVEDAPHAVGAFVGVCEDSWKHVHTFEELVGLKFKFEHKP